MKQVMRGPTGRHTENEYCDARRCAGTGEWVLTLEDMRALFEAGFIRGAWEELPMDAAPPSFEQWCLLEGLTHA